MISELNAFDEPRISRWHSEENPVVSVGGSAGSASEDAGQADGRQVHLLRCIFGNPFHTVTLLPAWQTATVVSLAQAIYDEQAFDRMPILADALEEAGCTNQHILEHCRQAGEHARGCWVVDLILEKS